MTAGAGAIHVGYSTNVHPAERWTEVRAALDRFVLPIRRRVAPGRRFGLGLRLSNRAAMELSAPGPFTELRDWLARHECYVFTLHGGPYGRFQGPAVKTAAFRPDWLDEDRLRYTDRLAALLAALVPAGVSGTINTIPGAFRARVRSSVDDAAMADRLLRHVALLVELHRKTGNVVALALEPEPACRLQTIGEAIEFFDRHLYARGAVARVAGLTRLDPTGAADAIRRHLGVCLDAAHAAVEFEEPLTALRALGFAGIPVLKIQPTAALRARNLYDPQVRRTLERLAADDCLHQVVARTPGRLERFVDLPAALAAAPANADESRIHAHVPVAVEPTGALGSTRQQTSDLVSSLARTPVVRHVEVETYHWGALAPAHRPTDVVEGIVRELAWVTAHLGAVAKSA
jgi:hypothetical protein